jgi:hypothetical protein
LQISTESWACPVAAGCSFEKNVTCNVTKKSVGSEKMANNSRYDDTLMAMLQQHSGDMDFMNTIFGFMQRRTACFNGPKVPGFKIVMELNFSLTACALQAEQNFQTLIGTLTHQLEVYRKAEYNKKHGIEDDEEESKAVAAKKKAEEEAEQARKKKVI